MFCAVTIDCCWTNRCCNRDKLEDKAPILDLITGVAILIIGLLLIFGVLHAAATISWLVLGIGACYTGLAVYKLLASLKKSSTYSDIRLC